MESGVYEKAALVFGQMDEPPGVRLRVALSALTMAEYFRDVAGQDVLLFVDNIFRFRAGRFRGVDPARPHAVGRGLPAHARRRDGPAAGTHHLHQEAARSRRCRPCTCLPMTTPTRAVHHLHPPRCHHRARPYSRLAGHLPGRGSAASTSTILEPEVVGDHHYEWPVVCRRRSSATRSCRTSSPSSAWTSCPKRIDSPCPEPARSSVPVAAVLRREGVHRPRRRVRAGRRDG